MKLTYGLIAAIFILGCTASISSFSKDKAGNEEKLIRGKIDAVKVYGGWSKHQVVMIPKYFVVHKNIAYELWFPRSAKMGQPTTNTSGVIAMPIAGYRDGYPIDLGAIYEITGQVIHKESDFTEGKSGEVIQECFQKEMKSGLEDRCEQAVKFRDKDFKFRGKYPIELFRVRSLELSETN